jgi:glycosyltransferase involved in cell wall biosynthesis
MERRITPVGDLVALSRLVRLFRRLRPDIVHAHSPKGGLLGMMASRLANVQVRVHHVHGLPHVTSVGFQRRLLRSTERVSCHAASAVLCVSRSVREVVVAEGICDADRIEVLAGGSVNGIDATGRFRPPADAAGRDRAREALGLPAKGLVLGFVGRIVRDKGWGELAEAWRGLRDRYPDLRLLVAGPFEKRDPVSDDVARLITGDPRITYVGVQWNTPPLYAAMDLVVLPTYREGFPVVPLEAAAMALPVVATRIPGCVDAIEDGVTGTLVEARNAAELERALARYLSDEQLRRQHGAAARRRALESFSQEVIWRETLAFYRRLLKP